MKIAGLTIAKNCLRYQYPIAECIEQHSKFFHHHIIGVPMEHQDDDGTIQFIKDTCKKLGLGCITIDTSNFQWRKTEQIEDRLCIPDLAPSYSEVLEENRKYGINASFMNADVVLFPLDWPGENIAWTEESLDKKLQQYMLDMLDWEFRDISWICKLDIDEFYDDESIMELKEMMEIMSGSSNTCIAHNYKQYMGSLDYTIWDPTKFVCHIFQPYRAKFSGNDAMQFRPTEGEIVYLENIYLHHIGYVKDPDLITTRIREHLVLNESMYPNAIHNNKKWKNYKFEFPKHVVGAKLWPIGISDQPNETEYTPENQFMLPSVLRNKKDEFNFYKPY